MLMMKKVAFHSNQIGLRGTEVSLYDYAHYNEVILGNRSIVISPARATTHHQAAIEKFSSRFPVYLYNEWSDAEGLFKRDGIDVLYCLKSGENDGLVSRVCKTVVHAVFAFCEPHGDVYAYISEWLARAASPPGQFFPFVPHMIERPRTTGSMRADLGIPEDAVVFGRYGGSDTFDIDFAQAVVADVAVSHPERYFLFMNTNQFCPPRKNIIYLDGTADMGEKERFIGTCDAMLHARRQGESFGLAVGEFSIRGKPVITWFDSPERNHIGVLGKKGIYYRTHEHLRHILVNFKPDPSQNWDAYSEHFSPEVVMEQFRRVFLEG